MGYSILINSTKGDILVHVMQELNGHEEALVILTNTPTNRTLISTDQDVVISWGTTNIFTGLLTGAGYGPGKLECKVYNKAYLAMEKHLITDEYANVAANVILDDILEQDSGTTTSDGNVGGTTVIDSSQTESDDFFTGMYLKITSGAQSGQIREITNWVLSTKTFTVSPAFGGQILSGVTYRVFYVKPGSCPATSISVQFKKATCLNAARFLADSVDKDHWTDGMTFNIGTRGSAKGSIIVTGYPKRGIDRAKQRNHVWVRGYDADGATIWGEAKSGGWTAENDNPIVINSHKAQDTATLDNIAAKELELQELESSGVKLEVSPDIGYNLYPGDTVTLARPDLKLVGDFRIWKITKKPDKAEVEVDRPEMVLENQLTKLFDYEEMGIYVPTAVCTATCQTECQVACQVTCEPACQQTCQNGGGCQTACQATCQTECQPTCQTACQDTAGCQTVCQETDQTCAKSGNCQVACQQTCQGNEACETGGTCQTACEVGHTCETTCQSECQDSAGCQVACQATCQTECQPGCQTECQDSAGCQVACQASCQTQCQPTCQIACQDTAGCQTACQNTDQTCAKTGNCQSACQSTCQGAEACETGGTCQTACQAGHTCESACQTACQTTCQQECQNGGGCQVACQTTCQEECQVACQTTCEPTCQLACQDGGGCQTACQATCQTECQPTCQTACQDTAGCQTVCQASNQTCAATGNCQVACQQTCQQAKACEGGGVCQTSCQSGHTCETACQSACQSPACQTSCQTSCQTACQPTCQTECQDSAGCQVACQVVCQTECQSDVCQMECQLTCQTVCQPTCQTECQDSAGCQVACQSSCQTQCQPTCQTACQDTAGCQVACQVGNQTCAKTGNCQLACQSACQGTATCEVVCETVAQSIHYTPENYLPNPGFEIDSDSNGIADGWATGTEAGSPGYGRSSAYQKRGKWSQYISCFTTAIGKYLVDGNIPVVDGRKYYCQVYAKGSVAHTQGYRLIAISQFDKNGNYINDIYPSADVSVTTVWKLFSGVITVGDGTATEIRYISFRLFNSTPSVNATVYFDEPVFSEQKAASPTIRVVGAQGLGYTAAQSVANLTWVEMVSVTVGNVDMETLFVQIHLGVGGVSIPHTIWCRIYDSTDGIYYPLNNSGSLIQPRAYVPAWNVNGFYPTSFFITIPKNAKNHVLKIHMRHDVGSAKVCACNVYIFGHSPHTHQ